ncbi:MAG: ABC transporter ATP-binding protein [Pseudomonadota bacterium]
MTQAPEITLSGSATWAGSPIFSDISLTLPAGQWTCLLGQSGVGKSTLLRLIAGIADGLDFKGQIAFKPEISGRKVTFMAQDDLLLPWLSAQENILLGARLRGDPPDRKRAAELLAKVGLSDHAHKKPKHLSGGQRQRVSLARTLMEDCPVVLLDEPFSALDALTRLQMQDLTTELLLGKTILLVTHDPSEAARLGQVIYLMEQTGLRKIPAPNSKTPRSLDAAAVLKTQKMLYQNLLSHPELTQ